MKELLKIGLTAAFFVGVTGIWTSSFAGGDLPAPKYGSIKDVFVEAPPPPRGDCYLRVDNGYSFSSEPEGWSGGPMNDEDLDDGYFFEGGAGCGLGRGFRGELVVGYRSEKDYEGHPDPIDPFLTSVKTYTLMANIHYDFRSYGKFQPYIGAGIGFAYHDMDDVYCTPATVACTPTAPVAGDEELSFAWSLMVGFGYQISDRATFDLAYRYIDLGEVSSERWDPSYFVNPPLELDNLTAHEIKAGIRYSLGGGSSAYAHHGGW